MSEAQSAGNAPVMENLEADKILTLVSCTTYTFLNLFLLYRFMCIL